MKEPTKPPSFKYKKGLLIALCALYLLGIFSLSLKYPAYNSILILSYPFVAALQHWILPYILYNKEEKRYLRAKKAYDTQKDEKKVAFAHELQNGDVNKNIENHLKRRK
tara:strand:+ start:2765 stop:3091 length:327 start_codon:yes stop_codon:yes gene_type:complete